MSHVERLHPLKYRSIRTSDIHLGFRGCQTEFVLDFLHSTDCKQLYMVGDINRVMYYNRGDWMESCIALVEHHDGSMALMHWTEAQQVMGSGWAPSQPQPEPHPAAAMARAG